MYPDENTVKFGDPRHHFTAIRSGWSADALRRVFFGGWAPAFAGALTRTGFTLALSSIGFRYCPVADRATSAIRSGGPSAMIFPPFTPPPGPRSITQSAVLMT